MYKTIPLSLFLLSLTGSGMACETVGGIKFTAYGFPDAFGIPAYKCNGDNVAITGANDRTQLGDGSFGNPYAAAAAGSSIFQKCELLYMPLLKKYFRVQDDCSGCGQSSSQLCMQMVETLIILMIWTLQLPSRLISTSLNPTKTLARRVASNSSELSTLEHHSMRSSAALVKASKYSVRLPPPLFPSVLSLSCYFPPLSPSPPQPSSSPDHEPLTPLSSHSGPIIRQRHQKMLQRSLRRPRLPRPRRPSAMRRQRQRIILYRRCRRHR